MTTESEAAIAKAQVAYGAYRIARVDAAHAKSVEDEAYDAYVIAADAAARVIADKAKAMLTPPTE